MREPLSTISFQDFLVWEAGQADKHEFFAGTVRAFSGGTMDHSAISRNILVAIDGTIEPPCHAHGSDAIIETVARKQRHGLRADVVVTCSPDDFGAAKYLQTPRLVVEVISPSNDDDDWREKLLEYWNTASIRQLVLVESELRRVEYFVRDEDGAWQPPVILVNGGVVAFELGFEITLDRIYERTSLDTMR